MQLVQRWWNGLFGRLARRDIWLEQGTIWRVRARQGDGDGRTKTWTFETRDQAEAMIQRLLTAEGPGEWKDITAASAASFPPQRPLVGPPDQALGVWISFPLCSRERAI